MKSRILATYPDAFANDSTGDQTLKFLSSISQSVPPACIMLPLGKRNVECISKLKWPSGKRRSDETNLPCRRFSLAEIKTATNNFDDNLFIGEWNYRKVYKGFIDDPTISVAIKCVNTKTMPGSDWLRNEVLLLCQLHHPNLLRLIGYCIEDKLQEFLVYEFMVNGNLGNHLYGTNHHEPLQWAQSSKREGAINEIVDPYLMGKITPECFKVYIDIATTCVRRGAKHRPNMGEVQAGLEHALEIQESADAASKDVDPTGDYNYPIDEYICNDSPDDTSSMEMGWNSFGEERFAFTEELSLDTAMPSGQI
uniref:Protein kinase domain-containing protein n=1 Tax=Quercus lobata TaxID=97700 RepID=A0A7N2MUD5_QUELO